ncbi:MAG: hypothetical protein ACO1OT_07555 [Heyndrickxia sp.]
MMWIYIFTPIIILAGIAIYFDKKYGATSPERTSDKLEEYLPVDPFGPNHFGP